jgi:hypothetical protein
MKFGRRTAAVDLHGRTGDHPHQRRREHACVARNGVGISALSIPGAWGVHPSEFRADPMVEARDRNPVSPCGRLVGREV